MNSTPDANLEQEPTAPKNLSQPAEHTLPSTPLSLTSAMGELGERLEAKNEADPLAAEESA